MHANRHSMRVLSLAVLVWAVSVASARAESAAPIPTTQLSIDRVDLMPNQPRPFKLRDFRATARGYDKLIFDFHATGDLLPLIWWDDTKVTAAQPIVARIELPGERLVPAMSKIPVTIINHAMARKYWPNEDSLGKMLGLGSPRFPPMKVVGIVVDMKHQSLREDVMPEMYVTYTQKPYPSMLTMQAIVRTHGEPAAALGSIRTAMAAVDADLPVAKVSTLQTIVDQSMTRPRFAMLLLGGFGVVALALASIGMYGVIAHSVNQRTREIGVRMALGADPGQVFGMMLKQGARLAGLGIAIGVGTALGVTQLLKTYLYQVKSTDPATFVGVAALLVSVALLACWIPARRAMRVDPMVALRHE